MSKQPPEARRWTRRAFGQTLAGAAAALSVPMILPARLLSANVPSDRLRIGQIGCGRIAQIHDMPGVLKSGLADYVAVCDLDSIRLANGRTQVETFYRTSGMPSPDVHTYSNYHELLRHPDLDGVVISTPDHWHAELALAAVLAGKDVYLQKPFTMTLAEGILLRDGDVRVSVSDKHANGLKFFGDDGWIWVTRTGQTTASDPTTPGVAVPPLAASDPRLLADEGLRVHLPRSDEHHRNWLESMRSRREPIAPARIAHRSGSACIVSWIAMKLGRPLTWDAQAERFVNDAQANAMLARTERAPYGAHRLVKT